MHLIARFDNVDNNSVVHRLEKKHKTPIQADQTTEE